MTVKEKILYHQIHPFKLFIDIVTSILTTYFAWQHNVIWFLILFLMPSVITTLLLVKYSDLDRLKNSTLGKYVERYMTRTIEVLRFGGQIMMWVAAWFHLPILIALGVLIIIVSWLNGRLFKQATLDR